MSGFSGLHVDEAGGPRWELALTLIESVDVELARATVKAATVADPRLGDLLDRYGSRWEFVNDYGMGRMLLARVDGDDNLTWELGHGPG